MDSKTAILRNSFLIGAATVAATAIGILQSAYVVRTLKGELFGKLVLMQTTWQTLALLTNFGTNVNGMYRMAAAIGSSDREKAAESLSYLMKGVFLSNVLAGLAAVGVSLFLPGYVGLGRETLIAFSLLGVLAVFSTPEVCAMAIVQARRRMELFSGLLVISAAVNTASTIILTYRFGVYGALVASSVASVVAAPFYISFIRRDDAASGGIAVVLKRKALRANFLDGFWMSLDRNIGQFYSILPYHIVNWIYGPSVTGSLRIASRLCEVSAIPQNAITTNAQSLIPVEMAQGNVKTAWKMFWKNVSIGGAMAVLSSVALLVFGKWILGLIYGSTGASSAYLIPGLIPYVLVAALGPIGVMYRLMDLVSRAVFFRVALTLFTAAILYIALPASDPSFSGLARSSFYVVSTAFLLWMVLKHKDNIKEKETAVVPVVTPVDAE